MNRGPLEEYDEGRLLSPEECEELKAWYKALVLRRHEIRATRRALIACVGMVASGKSTVMKQIARALYAPYMEGDELRAELDKRGVSRVGKDRVLMPVLAALLKDGYTVVYGGDAAGRVAELARFAKEAGASLELVHVIADTYDIKERLARREAKRLHGVGEETWLETYERRKVLHEDVASIDFLCTVNTSQEDAEAQIEHCIERIKTQA